MNVSDVIKDGLASGKTIYEINKELKENGCGFHLEMNDKIGWTEQEMKDGFVKSNEPEKPVVHLYDKLRLNKGMAGKSAIYTFAEGKYELYWNEEGNPVKAIRRN